MDFFEMDFSEFFLSEYGEKIFNDITLQIKTESPENYNKDYIKIVFKIAFFDYIGFTAEQIKKLLNEIYKNNKINVENILTTHKKSIKAIKKYLQSIPDIKV